MLGKKCRSGPRNGVAGRTRRASRQRAQRAVLDFVDLRRRQVLRDSQRVAEFRWDPETTADLFSDIAKVAARVRPRQRLMIVCQQGYTDAPDLRVVWLANLAKFHVQRQHYVEAAYVRCDDGWVAHHVLTFVGDSIVAAALVARCMRVLGRDAAGCVPQR